MARHNSCSDAMACDRVLHVENPIIHMKTLKKNDNFEYTYLIEAGISKIKGGLKVLKDMNYPKEILDNTKI